MVFFFKCPTIAADLLPVIYRPGVDFEGRFSITSMFDFLLVGYLVSGRLYAFRPGFLPFRFFEIVDAKAGWKPALPVYLFGFRSIFATDHHG